MKYPVVVLEGVDGSGKTSIAKYLAKKYKGIYLYSPPRIVRFFKYYFDTSAPLFLRYQYYLLGNVIYAFLIPIYCRIKPVFCDASYFSTLAYHSVLMKKDLYELKIFHADKIIYLTANWDIVEKRLKARKKRSKYEGLNFLKKVDKKYRKIFKNKQNVICIDTGEISIEKVVEKILKMK